MNSYGELIKRIHKEKCITIVELNKRMSVSQGLSHTPCAGKVEADERADGSYKELCGRKVMKTKRTSRRAHWQEVTQA